MNPNLIDDMTQTSIEIVEEERLLEVEQEEVTYLSKQISEIKTFLDLLKSVGTHPHINMDDLHEDLERMCSAVQKERESLTDLMSSVQNEETLTKMCAKLNDELREMKAKNDGMKQDMKNMDIEKLLETLKKQNEEQQQKIVELSQNQNVSTDQDANVDESENYQQKLDAVTAENEELVGKNEKLENDLKQIETERDWLQEQMDVWKTNVIENEQDADSKILIELLNKDKEMQSERIAELVEENDSSAAAFEGEIDGLKKEIEEYKQQLEELRRGKEDEENEKIRKLSETNEALSEHLQRVSIKSEEERVAIRDSIESMQSEIEEKEEMIDGLQVIVKEQDVNSEKAMQELTDRNKELESEIAQLKSQMKELEADKQDGGVIDDSQQAAEPQNDDSQLSQTITPQNSVANEENDELKKTICQQNEEIKELEEALTQYKMKDVMNDMVNDAVTTERKSIDSERDNEIKRYKEEIEGLNELIEDLKDDLEKHEKTRKTIVKMHAQETAEQDRKAAKLERRVSKLELTNEDKEARISQLNFKNEEMEQDIEELRETEAEKEEERQSIVAIHGEELNKLQEELEQVDAEKADQLQSLEKELEDCKAANSEQRDLILELNEKNELLEKAYDESKENQQREIGELKEEVSQLRQENDLLKAMVESKDETRKSLVAMHSKELEDLEEEHEKKISDLQVVTEEQDEEISRLSRQNGDIIVELEKHEMEKQEQRSSMVEMQDEWEKMDAGKDEDIELLKQQLEEEKVVNQEQQEAICALEMVNNDKEEKINRLSQENAEVKEVVDDLKSKGEEQRKSIVEMHGAELSQLQANKEEEIEGLERRLQEAKENNQDQASIIRELNEKVEVLEGECDAIKEKKQSKINDLKKEASQLKEENALLKTLVEKNQERRKTINDMHAKEIEDLETKLEEQTAEKQLSEGDEFQVVDVQEVSQKESVDQSVGADDERNEETGEEQQKDEASEEKMKETAINEDDDDDDMVNILEGTKRELDECRKEIEELKQIQNMSSSKDDEIENYKRRISTLNRKCDGMRSLLEDDGKANESEYVDKVEMLKEQLQKSRKENEERVEQLMQTDKVLQRIVLFLDQI